MNLLWFSASDSHLRSFCLDLHFLSMQFSMFAPALYEQGLKHITFKLLSQAFDLEQSLSRDSLFVLPQMSASCQQLFEDLFDLLKSSTSDAGRSAACCLSSRPFRPCSLATACLVYHQNPMSVKHFLSFSYVFLLIHMNVQKDRRSAGNTKAADQLVSGFLKPAASYFPRRSPTKYPRRWGA